jgi:hypothetical protein
MSRRQNHRRRLGNPPEEHAVYARENFTTAHYDYVESERFAKEGRCASALASLSSAAKYFGRGDAHQHGAAVDRDIEIMRMRTIHQMRSAQHALGRLCLRGVGRRRVS